MLTTTVAGRTWNFSHAIGRNAAAGNGFTNPYAITVGPDGVMYVISRGAEGAGGVVAENKRIAKVTMDENLVGEFGRTDLTWGAGIAVDKAGNVYASDEYSNRIFVYDADGQKEAEWGEPGTEEGQLSGPSGLALDADENMYVVDSMNDRVQKFTKDGKFLLAFGGSGSDDGQFDRPWGITIDGDGDVFVADWGNDRVQKFSPDGDYKFSFGGASGSATALNRPSDVAVDSEGDVYVVNWGDFTVKIYESDASILTTLEGDAMEFSKWAKEVVESNPDVVKAYRRVKDISSLAKFARPISIAVDAEDRVIITESTRGRLQVYEKEKNYMDPQFNL